MKKEKKNNQSFPLVTVVLLLACAAAAFFAVRYVRKCLREPNVRDSLSKTSVLTGQDAGTISSDVQEYDNYEVLSSQLAGMKPTHQEWTNLGTDAGEKGFFCIATKEEGKRMVYSIDPENVAGEGYTLRDFNYIWVDSVNTGFFCLINIPGEVVDLSDYYILVHDDTGNLATRLVINCYEAKAVKLNNAIVAGTVIAPHANVEYNQTVVYGEVHAKAFTGSRAFYKEIPFAGYTEIFRETVKVSFTNVAIRNYLFRWLKTNMPEIYRNYPDDYVMTDADLANVTELDMEGQYIASLYDDLKYLVNLQRLNLKKTKIKSLDVSFLTKLEVLDVSDSELAQLILPANGCLKELNAAGTNMGAVETKGLVNAETVNFAGVMFVFQPDYSEMKALRSLNISSTGFTGFRESDYPGLASLEKLDASENYALTQFEPYRLPNLKELDVGECGLTGISLENCPHLEFVDISYARFKVADLTGCPTLKRVEAYGDFDTIIVPSEDVNVLRQAKTAVEIRTP